MSRSGRIGRDLKRRTARWSMEAVRIGDGLPGDSRSRHLGDQLVRSATSVGAHVHEGSRARSESEFVSKLNVAIQEADEARYWSELLAGLERGEVERVEWVYGEADELIAIFTSIVHEVDASNRAN